jgi:DNA topoisomerase-1
VRKLEELGIGRPSTYAPTISIIQKRGYAVKKNIPSRKRTIKVFEWKPGRLETKTEKETYGGEKQKLVPTDIGIIVADFLVKNFENIVDYGFTARVEDQFDKIASGKYDWHKMLKEFYAEFEPVVETVTKESKREKGERLLGTDPETGKKVYAKMGPYGPMVQLGEAATDEKPKYASLLPGMTIMDITLEQALKLLKLPVKIGEHNGKELVIGTGKYGPYVRYGKKFVSIPAHLNPLELSLDEAVKLIEQKENQEKPVAVIDGKPVLVQRGKYGPYLKWDGRNFKIPRGTEITALTEEQIRKIISDKEKKDAENTLKEWPREKISIRKGGWGRYYIFVDGKRKKIVPKDIDPAKIDLPYVKNLLKTK